MTTDPAVAAWTAQGVLAKALGAAHVGPGHVCGFCRDEADAVLAELRPIILGLDRAAIAAALDDVDYDVPVPDGYIDIDYRAGFDAGIRYALTIVGGDSE